MLGHMGPNRLLSIGHSPYRDIGLSSDKKSIHNPDPRPQTPDSRSQINLTLTIIIIKLVIIKHKE